MTDCKECGGTGEVYDRETRKAIACPECSEVAGDLSIDGNPITFEEISARIVPHIAHAEIASGKAIAWCFFTEGKPYPAYNNVCATLRDAIEALQHALSVANVAQVATESVMGATEDDEGNPPPSESSEVAP